MDTELQPIAQEAGEPPVGDPGFQDAMNAGHETTDVNIRSIFIFAFTLLCSLAIVLCLVAVFFGGFGLLNRKLNTYQPAREQGALSQVRIAPDYQGPLLQANPEDDLRGMRARNGADLQTYGWIDRQGGVVRMPVDHAMDVLAARGLPPVSPGKTLEALQRERAQPQVFGQSLRP